MKLTFSLAMLLLSLTRLVPAADTRTWTSAEGASSFEGELLEFDDTQVKIKRSADFQIFPVPLEKLSTADQTFVRGLLREQVRDAGLKEGPHSEKVTGEWVKATSAQGLNYQFLGNPKWKRGERYPLLIWLHGAGQSGSDNEAQMGGATKAFSTPENQDERPCFILAPQCPSRDIGWKNEVTANLMALIADLTDHLPIDESRIYLTGSSMGGFGSWNLATNYPGVFAAVVPLCGGGDPKKAEILKTTPIWAFHGDKDEEVSVEKSRAMFQAIQAIGGELIQYSELAGEGHLISGGVYAKPELHEWIFAQKKAEEQ